MNIKERIKELADARQMKMMWQERENFLSRPLVDDLSIIDELWRGMGDYSIRKRKAFIFVVLYFFSPQKLVGGKMSRGVMRRLVAVTSCTKSVLSHNCEDVVMQYRLYKDFRAMVDELAKALAVMLLDRGCDENIINCVYGESYSKT